MFAAMTQLAITLSIPILTVAAVVSNGGCRCGQLIANRPIAESCYPGQAADEAQCSAVSSSWRDISYQINSPIGYPQPVHVPCAPINTTIGENPKGSCTLGSSPVYTVNATSSDQIAAGIAFARRHNIRLVIRDTGHDFLGRSTGYGSLQVWIRYVRTGIHFHDRFDNPGSRWNGSAVTIGGGYQWVDVYEAAAKKNLIVVGGVSPSVGCIGGWMQGGGHGPPTHKYGLGSDQVLEAKVVLANGSLVTANPVELPDLFFAVRGGGPSSYGVVVEATVKAWPSTPIVGQSLLMTATGLSALSEFMAALKDLYAGAPLVAEKHWGGYGDWMVSSSSTFYSHKWSNFDLGLEDAKASFEPIAAKLAKYNSSSLVVTVNYTEHPTYADFYNTYHFEEGSTGDPLLVASRFYDVEALGRDDALAHMLNVTAGDPSQGAINTFELHGAPFGAVGKDDSAAHPAWRDAVVNQNTYLAYQANTSPQEVQSLVRQITDVKEPAMKALAPNTGSYGSVANLHNPHWKEDFFGDGYGELVQIKAKYDPDEIFHCRTCVGSDRWSEEKSGRLCRV